LSDFKTDMLITRYFQEARHVEDILGIKEDGEERDIWFLLRRRYSKDRMKTVSVALVLCLHIGVDPPDSAPKTSARARLEAWVDPYSCSPQKAAYKIAKSLQNSYERWQPRARYKSVTDPTGDDVRKLCMSMRRNAKDERVLFHYNGHGVPRPTQNGEIWVFNKNFTQYIPLSLYDLQLCMDFPSIYVWDCSSAETIVNWFMQVVASTSISGARINSHMTADQQAESLKFQRRPKFRDCIQLAACREDERLPTNPDLPADLFTSCLTTPIHTSILWYLIKSGRKSQFPPNLLEEIPGQLNDRRTILGELNWIFTAITDTIAWNALPRDDFQRLFRQDLLLASLFRSFLLAERVMGGNDVVSSPSLPSTADHPLWDSWEYTLDLTLHHIHNLLSPKIHYLVLGRDIFFKIEGIRGIHISNYFPICYSFQLVIFVWLEYGVNKQSSPEQLPIVLQVLLSQAHRQRALELLARFLDLGQWAVGYSLSVGIFPYMLKLLQSTSRELRTWLAFIWAKILAVDPSVQSELFKENGDEPARFESTKPVQLRYHFFVTILNDPDTLPRQKIVVAFVLATLFHNNYRIAQENLTKKGYVNLCTELLTENQAKDCRLLKLWILIGLGRLWADYDPARWQAVRLVAYAKVLKELDDNAPEVRAAAVYALGCLVKNRSETNEHAATVIEKICDDLCNKCTKDGSVLVREELLIALQWYIIDFEQRFAKIFWDLSETLSIEMIEEAQEDHFDLVRYLYEILAFRQPGRKSSVFKKRQRASDAVTGIEEVNRFAIFNQFVHRFLFKISLFGGLARKILLVFRERAKKQLAYLENKNFKEPLERTWVALLRLSLDPVEKVPFALLYRASTPCDTLLVASRVPTSPTVVSFSMLRKSIYTTDGDQIYITRYEKTHNNIAQKFSCNGGNPFNSTTSLIVINEMSREMLLCGSSTGIVRVWDLSYNIHSHEIEDLPQLVTASNPLCDQSRFVSFIWRYLSWSQDTGRLVCGGNVRIIRVWDAHYERTAQDIAIGVKKGAVCSLSGYRDGVVNVHDIRVPSKESLIMSFHDLSSRVVGVAIRADYNGKAIVAAADGGGGVCVWEPRMFKVRSLRHIVFIFIESVFFGNGLTHSNCAGETCYRIVELYEIFR
uniref:Raptor_N domain-containing protein n=1 Tax=Heligmosomoides polygyrus TaxID=6339 RepID=A0A8L8JZU0_HELPZ